MKVAALVAVALILCISFPGPIQAKEKSPFCVGKDGKKYAVGDSYVDNKGQSCIRYKCAKKKKTFIMKKENCDCNGGNHGIPCCPNYVRGDMVGGSEINITFSPNTENGCQNSCKIQHPTSIGVTQDHDGTSSCYCEFGSPIIGGSANEYKTCLFSTAASGILKTIKRITTTTIAPAARSTTTTSTTSSKSVLVMGPKPWTTLNLEDFSPVSSNSTIPDPGITFNIDPTSSVSKVINGKLYLCDIYGCESFDGDKWKLERGMRFKYRKYPTDLLIPGPQPTWIVHGGVEPHVMEWTPQSGKWKYKLNYTSPLPVWINCIVMIEGKILQIGGVGDKEIDGTRHYKKVFLDDVEKASLKQLRGYHHCTIFENRVWVAGGCAGSSCVHSETVEIYDYKTDTWSYGPSLPFGAKQYDFTPKLKVINEDLYYIGSNCGAIFKLVNNVWKKVANIPTGPKYIAEIMEKGISTTTTTTATGLSTATTTSTGGFNMSATCDDVMWLFADEDLLVNNSSDWRVTSEVHIPACTKVIEIHCLDSWIHGGILASSDNGLITDGAWNCSSDNGTTWNPAYLLGRNGRTAPDISSEAIWIWTDMSHWMQTDHRRHTKAICKIDLETSQCPEPPVCPPFGELTPTTILTPTSTPTPAPTTTSTTSKPKPGILASSDNGLLTDGSWNCSSDNGTTWNAAYEAGPNSGAIPDISPDAEWIWTGCIQDWTSKYTGKKHQKNVICKIDLKPIIDGGWSEWSAFSQCSATCGDSTKTRTRTCSNPPPRNGGEPCLGLEEEVVSCGVVPCGGDSCSYTDKYLDCPQWKTHCESGEWEQCVNENCPKTCKCTGSDSVYFLAGGNLHDVKYEIELYHPTMKNLSCSITVPSLDDRTWHTTFYFSNTVYLCGGYNTESTCISYNTNMNGWKTHALTTSRKKEHTSVVLNNRLYLIGGHNSSNTGRYLDSESTPLPLTDQPVLTPVPNLNYKALGPCTAKVDEDTLVVTGGYYSYGYLSTAIQYNVKTSTYTSLPSQKQSRSRHGCVVVKMKNTKWIIVSGGYGIKGNVGSPLQSTEMLQLGGRSWIQLGNLNEARQVHSMVATVRGILVMGGEGANGKDLSTVELLDLSIKQWSVIEPSLKTPRLAFGGAVEIPARMFDCTVACPIGWTALQTGCYRFVEASTFNLAITRCKEKGGFTAELKSQNEQDAFSQFMKDSGFSKKNVWLGASLVGNEWIWFHSKQKMTFSAWGPCSPSGGGETCVAAWGMDDTTLWNDITCYGYGTMALCQYSPVPG